jgi:hypothetical protein
MKGTKIDLAPARRIQAKPGIDIGAFDYSNSNITSIGSGDRRAKLTKLY